MNSTKDRSAKTRTTRPGSSQWDPIRLAPHVDRTWARHFVEELTLQAVPGERIGDALVTIDSHLAESGEGAQEAFGEPREYARSIAESGSGPAWSITARTVLGHGLGLLGMLIALFTFVQWLDGGRLSLGSAELLTVGVGAGVLLGFLAFARPILRMLQERPWTYVLLFVVPFALASAVMYLPQSELLSLPIWGGAALAVVLLGSSVLINWSDLRTEGSDAVVGPGEAPRSSGGGRAVTAFIPVILTLLLIAGCWLFSILF
ncbi:hypothetical protein [Ornithinimicrobium sp. Y1694]|uniref:hypothetical protein n=1 Tax=Ornithinimicrobium sp. Y1694 TaxID=3418590 RepID=UPI003CF3DB1F